MSTSGRFTGSCWSRDLTPIPQFLWSNFRANQDLDLVLPSPISFKAADFINFSHVARFRCALPQLLYILIKWVNYFFLYSFVLPLIELAFSPFCIYSYSVLQPQNFELSPSGDSKHLWKSVSFYEITFSSISEGSRLHALLPLRTVMEGKLVGRSWLPRACKPQM
jgi:hypothetical protein